jgi:hypothetical protein
LLASAASSIASSMIGLTGTRVGCCLTSLRRLPAVEVVRAGLCLCVCLLLNATARLPQERPRNPGPDSAGCSSARTGRVHPSCPQVRHTLSLPRWPPSLLHQTLPLALAPRSRLFTHTTLFELFRSLLASSLLRPFVILSESPSLSFALSSDSSGTTQVLAKALYLFSGSSPLPAAWIHSSRVVPTPGAARFTPAQPERGCEGVEGGGMEM